MPRPGFDDVPVNRHLRFRLTERDDRHATVEMDAAAEFEQETGVIHGGIITAVADTAAVYCLMPALPKGTTMTGIDLSFNFLRPAMPMEAPLVARASIVRRGRRLGVCDVDVYQGDRHVARGVFTYMFIDTRAKHAG